MVAANNRILDFYSGASPDHGGRYLQEILEWSDNGLERTHDYIQWLFPLPERSGFNVSAPVLDAGTIHEFRSRLELQRNMRASFVRMLTFYGLEMVGLPGPIRPSSYFAQRSANWLTESNHNHLRITRILRSLRILGLKAEALAFFDCLAAIYNAEAGNRSPRISDETFRFWRSAATEG
jgi:hypothetical protein